MHTDRPSLRAIFCEAAEIANAAERAAYIATACGEDEALRAEVEELLGANDTAGGFLVTGADRNDTVRVVAESAGDCIGRYKLLEKIGEGGCGEVYMAEQREPVRRKVALKIIKLGMDTRSVIARFEAERQALAMMDHPHIARILDAGATDSGRPYFVMELVQGRRITDFCDEQGLSPAARLKLFAQVCHAVQHAHLKGIIHRDLKPSNILVALHDGVPSPKIIDFGIAKATVDVPLTDKTLFTHYDAFLGTPSYMSPEQAERGNLDIDSRTDVYSLGVLLYELVTGRTPFDREKLQKSGIDGVRRILRDTEPPRPSTRLRGLPMPDLHEVARRRASPPPWLIAFVCGDLDWIVLRAMEKDRTRRYETARELAHDVERFLADEPIAARPPSRWYSFQKLVQRNRVLFGAAATTGMALALGLGLATVMFLKERAARERAVTAERTQFQLRRTADMAQQEAESEAEFSRQQLVRLSVQSGNKLIDDGDHHAALLWFAEALRLERGDAASEDVHRRRFAAARKAAPDLAQIWFHKALVHVAEFSADGAYVATAGKDGTARVWNAATGKPASPLLRHGASVGGTLFLDGGRRLLTVDAARKIRVWEVASGEITSEFGGANCFATDAMAASNDGSLVAMPMTKGVMILEASTGWSQLRAVGPPAPVLGVRLSAGGRWLMVQTATDIVEIWDSSSGQRVTSPLSHASGLRDYALKSDGGLAFTVTTRELHGWDANQGEAAWPPVALGADLFGFDLSPDGQLVAAGGWNGSVRVFDVHTGQPAGDVMWHHGGVAHARFSSDARLLATASWDGTARLWHTRRGEPASPSLRHAGYVLRASLSPDNSRLLTASPDETARLWTLKTNSGARLEFSQATYGKKSVQFNRDGTELLTVQRGRMLRVWDTRSGAVRLALAQPSSVQDAALDPAGRYIASVSEDSMLRFWDAKTGKQFGRPAQLPAPAWRVVFSPDGLRVATISAGDVVRISSVTNGAPLGAPFRHEQQITALAFNPDGSRLLTSSFDKTARLSDSNGQEIAVLRHQWEVHHAEFSPDGHRVLTACSDRSQSALAAQLWDAATGTKVGPPMAHLDGVVYATFSPDGRLIATCSEDKTALVWDAATGARLTPPLRHGSYVLHVAFSPDSRFVVTCSSDDVARVWDARTGAPVTPPLLHERAVTFAAWHPNGDAVTTVSTDGRVRLWDVSPERGSVEELRRFAELLSAHRLESSGGLVPLTADELRKRWEASRGLAR